LQKLVTKLSSNFEPYKPDKAAILQYLNNHTRQFGLEPPSFTNPKDKNNKSDKSERQQSSSSEKKNSKYDRSTKRKQTDASDFKSKSKDSKKKSRETSHGTKQTGNIPISEQCRNAGCQQ
jgi:hypothetical protein